MRLNWTILQFLVFVKVSVPLAPNELVVLILAQPDDFNHQFGKSLRSNLYTQSTAISKDHLINVHFLYEIFNHPGEWTFLAALPYITTNIIKPHTKWIILCEDQSSIDLNVLLKKLSKEDFTQSTFLGNAIYDLEATIIHHFAFFENPQWFPYPLLRSGIAFSVALIERMSERVRKANSQPRTEFSIDASYELALFILENIPNRNSANWETLPQPLPKQKHFNNHQHQQQGKPHSQKYLIQFLYDNSKNSNNVNEVGVVHGSRDVSVSSDKFTNKKKVISNKIYLNELYDESLNKNGHHPKGAKMHSSFSRLSNNWNKLILTNTSYFCTYNQSKYHQCAIRPSMSANFRCNSTSRDSIYFAIKTCSKFVKERIPTIERTWGRYIIHKRYFSDIADNDLPSIATGVPNTNTGHCSKTLSILKFALNDIEELHRKLLTPKPKPIKWIFLSDDDTILSVAGVCEILGCFNPTNEDVYLGERYGYRLNFADGFNYITGGGGIAFSLSTVRKILQYCTCPTLSSPDDMILGSCLHRLGVRAIHSARFHQARSPDYAIELLKLEKPISFHKFWQLDPFFEYEKWFRSDDDQMLLQERKINKRKMDKQDREHFQNSVLSHEKLDNSIQQKLPIPDVTTLAKPKHMEL